MLEEARAALPTVPLDDHAFAAHLAAVLPEEASGDPLASRLGALRAADLYLAAACARGVPEALRVFEERFQPDVVAAIARTHPAPDLADEISARVRRKLLVAGDGGRAPRIAEYSGRGDLHGWVKVVAAREAISAVRRAPRESPSGDAERLADLLGGDDPELEHLKRTYAAEFRDAFRTALAGLAVRERNLLRHQYVDGLSVDEVGAIYRVHRATAARWVAKAREELEAAVRAGLAARLRVRPAELESILRLVQSRLEVSLHALLRSGSGSDER